MSDRHLDPPEDQPGYWENNPPSEQERAAAGEYGERFQCPLCEDWMVDGDPANVRISANLVICDTCAAHHPLVVGEREAELRADERQDLFNETRR